MKIYFAGSIRGGREIQAAYSGMIQLLKRYGQVLTEHIGNANLDGRGEALGDREIHDRDLAWLESADILVAEVTTPSLGVGYEIGKATEWGKPVLCVCQRNGSHILSAMISGDSALTVRKYSTLTDFENMIREFVSQLATPAVRPDSAEVFEL